MSSKFVLTEDDKSLVLTDSTHENMVISIDFDDVDHQRVKRQVKRLQNLINSNLEYLTDL